MNGRMFTPTPTMAAMAVATSPSRVICRRRWGGPSPAMIFSHAVTRIRTSFGIAAAVNHVAARKVDLQRFRGQLNRARFHGRRSRVDHWNFFATTLKSEFVAERKNTVLKGITARLCAPPALISARLQSRPTSCGHEKGACQRDHISISDIGVHLPSPFDDR